MKKRVAFITVLLMVGLMSSTFEYGQAIAEQPSLKESKYKKAKERVEKNSAGQIEPDGKKVKITEVVYKDNKLIDKTKIKTVNELLETTVEDLEKKGTKISFARLMTYQEYFDQIDDSVLYHDIDPNRMVWVIQVKHSNTIHLGGYPIEKAIVTSLYDAETGIQYDMRVASEDPEGMKAVKRGN